jgi:hypothetical protein
MILENCLHPGIVLHSVGKAITIDGNDVTILKTEAFSRNAMIWMEGRSGDKAEPASPDCDGTEQLKSKFFIVW